MGVRSDGRRAGWGAVLLGVLAATLGAPALAQDQPADDPRWDPTTGRDLGVAPRGPAFDHRHVRLEIDIPDMERPEWSVRQTLRVVPLGRPRAQIELDAEGMLVTAVRRDGKDVGFEHRDGRLIVPLAPPARPGRELTLEFDHALRYPASEGDGVVWSAGVPEAPSPTDRVAQLHTQSQADNARRWWVCFDEPSDRLTSEVIARVPDGFEVLSNGRLLSRRREGSGMVRWHWSQSREHPPYLVSLVVGDLDVLSVAPPGRREVMDVYAPHGSRELARAAFARTGEMVRFLEGWFDEPYPWESLSQAVVRNFRYAGMENTGAVTYYERVLTDDPVDREALIIHEIAHMWAGNLLTCASWEHIWLNEAWATYAEALWLGEQEGEDGYQKVIRSYLGDQRASNQATLPAGRALATHVYADADARIGEQDDPYAKGVLVLHMLRERLGPDLFRRGAIAYIDRFKARGSVETDDFRRVLEEVSGRSLERFFDQWVRRAGLPRVEVAFAWDEPRGVLRVDARQTQTIDRFNPAYVLDLPVELELPGGERRTLYVTMDGRTASAEFDLGSAPLDATLDPRMTLLMDAIVDKPWSWWQRQAEHGSTWAARAEARDVLAERDGVEGEE